MAIKTSDRVTPLSGLGTVTGVPCLPQGFKEVFTSHRVETGDIGLHSVIGGAGEPLVLIGGWPQSWYIWRDHMLSLAKRFTVIAIDSRGQGASDRPADGYDMNTLAGDVLGLMDTLGHERFSMVGHDAGLMIGYGVAANRPDRVVRGAFGEGLVPGAKPWPPLFIENDAVADMLWHFTFNRVPELNERLVEGREHLYFDYQFRTKAGHPDAIPKFARDHYVDLVRQPGALRCSFNYYRAISRTIPQTLELMKTKLQMPILSFAGAKSVGPMQEVEWRILADNVEAIVFDDCGHYPVEEKPAEFLAAITKFLTQ